MVIPDVLCHLYDRCFPATLLYRVENPVLEIVSICHCEHLFLSFRVSILTYKFGMRPSTNCELRFVLGE